MEHLLTQMVSGTALISFSESVEIGLILPADRLLETEASPGSVVSDQNKVFF